MPQAKSELVKNFLSEKFILRMKITYVFMNQSNILDNPVPKHKNLKKIF